VSNVSKVSVCIPTYNRAGYLEETVRSVLAQTYREFELIISDNASTDNTEEVVASLRDPRIHYYHNPVNIGMAPNYNCCLERARGEYIAFICDDDMWHPEFLAAAVEVLDNLPRVGVVGCDIQLINHDGEPFSLVSERHARHRKLCPEVACAEGVRENLLEFVILNPCGIGFMASVIRRKCYEQVGSFADVICMDWDTYMRIGEAGWMGYWIARPLAKYRCHDQMGSNNRLRMAQDVIKIYEPRSFKDKQLNRERARILCETYTSQGLALLEDFKDNQQARKSFWSALSINCFYLRSWIGLITSFLPVKLQSCVRNTVRKIRRVLKG